jgi:GT2 family glycosyltransferase
VNVEVTINVVIVNWNCSAALRKCLTSIMASDYPSFRVLVVDNASTTEELLSLNSIREHFNEPRLYFVHNAENRGYAGGNNAGFQYIVQNGFDGDILVLNPDVEVEPNTLRVMAAAAVQDVGIVTPRVTHPCGKILFDGVRMNGYRVKYFVGQTGMQVSTDFAQGTCMLIRRDLIDQIGLFDEQFFLYWEEVDLSIRARSAGYRLVAANQTQIRKADNPLSRIPTCFYYSVRNANLIRTKHPSHFSRIGYLFYVLKIAALSAKLIGRPRLFIETLESVLHGLQDGLAGHYGRRGAL